MCNTWIRNVLILLFVWTTVPLHGEVLESWQFNDVGGTQLSGVTKEVGAASFSFDNAQVTTNGSGALEFTQGADANSNVFRSATLTNPNQTSGVFSLEWSYLGVNLSGGDSSDANLGFGLRENDSNTDLFLLRLHKQANTLRIQTRISGTNTNWFDFGASSLGGADTPLVLRAVADLDNDQLDVFYTLGEGAEQSVQDIPIPDLEFDSIRLVANTDTVDWGPTDVVTVDYLTLSRQLAPTNPIQLVVDTTTGLLTLANESGESIDIDFYEITSAGSLDPNGWSSLQSQDLPGFPAGEGIGNGWEPLGLANPDTDFNLDSIVDGQDLSQWSGDFSANGNSDADGDADSDGVDFLAWQQTFGEETTASTTLLAEAFLLGSSTLASESTLDLGNGFQMGGNEDLALKVRLADGTVLQGDVTYLSGLATLSVPEPTCFTAALLGLLAITAGPMRRILVGGAQAQQTFLLLVCAVSLFCFESYASGAPDRTRPNIVLVYADDMGIGDTSAYQDLGNNPDDYQIATPNMERLANMGTRFTDVHSSSAFCSPSRASLLTGRYSFRTDLKHSVVFDGQDISGTLMTQGGKTTKTVGNLLQEVGYQTYGVGKWHLGVKTDSNSINTSRNLLEGPTHVGFDRFTGTLGNPDSTGRLIEDSKFVKFSSASPTDTSATPLVGADTPSTNWIINNDDGELQHSKLTQRHLNAAKFFMSGHSLGGTHADEPFFLYYASHANHHPYYNADAIQTDADGVVTSVPITGNTVGGGPIRVLTIPDNDGNGIPEPSDPRYPGTTLTSADNLGEGWDRYYEEDAFGNQIDNSASRRADTVHENDIVLGELMDFLEVTDDPRSAGSKLIDNTLIIFTSDNGANVGGAGVGGLSQPSNGQPTDLRGRKATQWEGGTRVPLIAAWAGEVQAGLTSDALFGQQDLYATLAELTGQQLEASYADTEGADSESVLDAILGTATGVVRDSDLIYKRNAELIIRRGNLKLIASESDYNSGGARLDPNGESSGLDWQDLVATNLYNLANDLDESVNLINSPSWEATRDDLFQRLLSSIGPDAETGFTRGIVGDLNHDLSLDAADWHIFRAGFGDNLSSKSDLAAYKNGDLDGDLDVDVDDFTLFERAYDLANGAGAFSSLVTSVPEPSTVSLSLFVVSGWLLRRRG